MVYRVYHIGVSKYHSVANTTQQSYNPQVVEFLLTYYMPLIPWWSGIILFTVNLSDNATDSNAIVENWSELLNTT